MERTHPSHWPVAHENQTVAQSAGRRVGYHFRENCKTHESRTPMHPVSATLLWTLPAILSTLLVLWVMGTFLRDASIVDPFWGTGFVLTGWLAVRMNGVDHPRGWLMMALITVWGLRLSLHLLWRNWGHGEDRRYTAMRDHHGPRFWWVSLFTVFLLQGVILWIISFPVLVALSSDTTAPWQLTDVAGALLWMVGFAFETIGDGQLARFRSNPANAGKVLDRGLWRYTRHPNYFGDFCVWWGVYLVSIGSGAGWTVFSPLLMSILLMRVSGVTLLESTITDRRPDYAAYRARTNAFFPGRPKAR